MKTVIRELVVVIAACAGVGVYAALKPAPATPQARFAQASRGDVVMKVVATGALQATRTVDVGTQVSGVVSKMYADYNSIVKKGDLLAEIDSQPSQLALESASAAEEVAAFELLQADEVLQSDEDTLERSESLFVHSLITQQDREAAELQVKEDQAAVDEAKAVERIAAAGAEQAAVTLSLCKITAPIDGVVVSRNADQGQAVTASATVPSLYELATDIGHLELAGQVDEADIGKLHPGQSVAFTVEAYPGRQFHGTMTHVRLDSTTVNNVVVYEAVVEVQNPDLRLLPSMTAHMTVELARAPDALRVPNMALRFAPTKEMLAAFGQPALESGAGPEVSSPAGSAPVKSMSLAALPPVPEAPGWQRAAEMTDSRFRAMPRPVSRSQVWVIADGQLKSVPVTVGLTDGTWSEVLGGAIHVGDAVITSIPQPAKSGR